MRRGAGDRLARLPFGPVLAGGPRPRPPALWGAAARALRQGRAALARGDRRAALAAFAAAVEADATAFCHDWGLVPLLDAEGRGSVRDRMRARVATWWQDGRVAPEAPLAARLQAKTALRAWAAGQGFQLPPLIAQAASLEALDWAALPADRMVIKPANADSRRGVIVLQGGVDHIAQAPVGPDLVAYARRLWAAEGLERRAVLVEALLVDSEAATRPDLIVPRDTKVFAAGGRAVVVLVLDRNAPDGMRSEANFDARGRPLPATSQKWPHLPAPAPPHGFAATAAAAERLSALLPQLLRLDFYATPEGPVLGEVTAYPSAGLDLTPFLRRTLLQMWEMVPD
jgi:hypothetical protein